MYAELDENNNKKQNKIAEHKIVRETYSIRYRQFICAVRSMPKYRLVFDCCCCSWVGRYYWRAQH